MKLSIIIPAFNERNTILKILEKIEKVKLNLEKEIIIVDDYSTDGTRELLIELGGKYKIIYQEKNLGKGAAVKKGFIESTGDFIIIQDADLEYNPEEYGELLGPIIDDKADVVYGSRLSNTKPHRVLYFWHYIGNKFITTLSNIFTNLNLTDMETGYKAFSRKAVDLIKDKILSKRFGIEPEITALIAKNNLRVY